MSPYRRHTPPEAVVALDQLAEALRTYRAERHRLALEFARAVQACVVAKATWGEVGAVVGMTKQAARAHWAPFLERRGTLPHGGRFLDPTWESPVGAGAEGAVDTATP